MEPFVQLPFAQLPAHPTRPHGFFDLPERRVSVWTEHFGDTTASVRVAGSGPPLLLLHGLMTTGYSYRYVIERLAQEFTVYVPDLVGCGRSSRPRAAYPPEQVSEWLDHLVSVLGVRGCTVVGNSMGGYLALDWALRHPRSVRRLLVVHAPLMPTPRLYALWLATRLPGAHLLLRWLVQRDVERWAHHNVHYWDESLKSREETREYGAPLATDSGMYAFFRQLRDTMDVRPLRRLWRALDARSEAGAHFPIPLRLLYARRDPMVPPATGHALLQVLPDADLQWIERGSHFAHVDAVDAFLEAALPFLRG